MIIPSATMSQAICTLALAVRFPLRVWSMYNVRSSTLNSKSILCEGEGGRGREVKKGKM